MPALLLAGSIVCSLLGAATAHGWSSPRTIPAPAGGEPRALAVDRDGNAIVVWGTDVLQRSPGELTVDVLRAGDANPTRLQRGRSLILDVARSAAGDVDLLVQEGTRSPFRLVLLHVARDGSARVTWTTTTHIPPSGFGAKAAVARRGSHVAVAWLAARSSRRFAPVRLRLAVSQDGRRFRTRTVGGVLPSWVDNHLGSVHSSDLAIDAAGEPVIAFTARRTLSRKTLVLASITRSGRVRTRQLNPGVEGLVTMRATQSGRIGVLVEDTGIEGDFGECVNDPTPRRLWAVIRERGSRRFGVVQPIATPPVSCYHTEGRLVTGPADRLAIVWGTAPEAPPELPTIQAAFAEVNLPFAAPATIATGLLLRSAAFDSSALNVAMIRSPEAFSLNAGPLFSQRFPLGGLAPPAPLEPLDGSYVWRVLSDADPSGLVALAWQRRPRGDLLLSVAGG